MEGTNMTRKFKGGICTCPRNISIFQLLAEPHQLRCGDNWCVITIVIVIIIQVHLNNIPVPKSLPIMNLSNNGHVILENQSVRVEVLLLLDWVEKLVECQQVPKDSIPALEICHRLTQILFK